ncbi:MAG: cobyric acid synthase CobQ, partial [Methanocellales archaeon]|nr:cobyric acid synthase CobQ [Methanocellales archaeon]
IIRSANEGNVVIGICGGFQILGKKLIDNGFESNREEIEGLGLLDVITRFDSSTKITKRVEGTVIGDGILEEFQGEVITGYEIHMGKTTQSDKSCFLINRGDEVIRDGAIKGSVFGTYVHGIFDKAPVRKALLKAIKRPSESIERDLDDEINRLATIFSESVDVGKIEAFI